MTFFNLDLARTLMTSPTPISATTAVLRKTFVSHADYATFALTEDAPRYSVTLSSGIDSDVAPLLGLTKSEALFSDEITELCRAALAWAANGFEIFIDKGSNYPQYPGCPDNWGIRANANVPARFLEDVFIYSIPDLATPVAEVEEAALHALSGYDGGGYVLNIVDKEIADDREYLGEVLADPEEHKGWL